jgi:O-antigen/teichoic acid export membrane protein
MHGLGTWRALLRSFSTLAAGEVAARLFGFIAIVAMARQLGPSSFGIVVLGTTLITWFALVGDAGTEVLSLREVARRPERFKDVVEPVLGLRLALSLVGAALFLVGPLFLMHDQSDRAILWAFALVLPMMALNPRWIVVGVGGSRAVALGNIGSQVLMAAGVLLLVESPHDAVRIPFLQAGAELLYALIVLGAVGARAGRFRPRVDLGSWRKTLRDGAPLLAHSFSRAVIYSFDLLLIALLIDRTHVGLYSAAYKPVLFCVTALGLFYVSFLASLSAATGEQRFRLFRRTVLTAAGATLPVAAVLSATAGVLVTLVFGDSFEGAGLPLAILVWGLPLLAVSGAYGNALIAGDRQKFVMRNNIVAAVANILANLVAVPLFGLIGAAVVTVACEMLVLMLNYRCAVSFGLAPSVTDLAPRVLVVLRLRPSSTE